MEIKGTSYGTIKDNLDQVHPEYREKAVIDLKIIIVNCYITVENDKAIDLIMDVYFYMMNSPKREKTTELIVSKKVISIGIGNMLMNIKLLGCDIF